MKHADAEVEHFLGTRSDITLCRNIFRLPMLSQSGEEYSCRHEDEPIARQRLDTESPLGV
jgi:hypothetical protein